VERVFWFVLVVLSFNFNFSILGLLLIVIN
jgi:hypothetical protein